MLLRLTVIVLFAASCVVRAQTPAAPAMSPDAAFRAIVQADEAWRRAQRDGGESDEDTGGRRAPAHLPKVDLETQNAALAHWTSVLQALDALHVASLDAPALSPAEHLNYEVFRAQIVTLLNRQRFREYERPMNSDSAFWSDITSSGRDGFRSEDEALRDLTRLGDVAGFLRDNEANMRAGLARGFTPPQVTLAGRDASIRSVADAKSAEETSFYKPFRKLPPGLPIERQQALRAQAKVVIEAQIIPAYKELLRFFDDVYVPHAAVSLAATSLPDGRAYYQSLILEYATTTQTPEEIHTIGLAEMDKIHAEMLTTMLSTGFKGDLPAFLHFLRTDPQFYAKSPEELLHDAAWIAKEFDGISAKYFGYLPRQRFAIVPVPPEIAPFYTSARGGAGVYLVNTFDLPSRALYSLPALTLHESAPGHAFQIPIAAETADAQKLPRFRRQYISAYGEGWALYCERLGAEMGLYHTPYEHFGMLSYQAWRAARLVVDTGVHALGWTRPQAQQYLRDNTALSEHEIETEVDRYISWPGQALSYYLGEMQIQASRHKAETGLGARFNLRAFHDEVLSLGSVPLPVLAEQVDAWTARGGLGPYPEMER